MSWNAGDGVMDPRNVQEELRAFLRSWGRVSKAHFGDRTLVRAIARLTAMSEALDAQIAEVDRAKTPPEPDQAGYYGLALDEFVRNWTKSMAMARVGKTGWAADFLKDILNDTVPEPGRDADGTVPSEP